MQPEPYVNIPQNTPMNLHMNPIDWPQLNDQGASEFCDFIQGLSWLAESHYLAQIRRHHRQRLSESVHQAQTTSNIEQLPLFCDDEPF